MRQPSLRFSYPDVRGERTDAARQRRLQRGNRHKKSFAGFATGRINGYQPIDRQLSPQSTANASVRVRTFYLVLQNGPVLSVNTNLLSCVFRADIKGIPKSASPRLLFQFFIDDFSRVRLESDSARLCDSGLGFLCKLLAGERLRTHTCNQQSARQSNSKIFLHLILHGGFDLDSMLLRLTLTVAYGRSSRLNKCRKQLERPEVLQPF